jgi:hypothetical protein
MSKEYIQEYIKEAQGRGKTEAEIRMALSTHPGVTDADIHEAFGDPAPMAPISPAVPPLGTGGIITPPSHPLTGAPLQLPEHPKQGRKILGVVLAILIVLVVAGVAAAQYTGTYSLAWLPVSSQRVWDKLQGQSAQEPVSSEFSFSYVDAAGVSPDSLFGGALKNLKVEVKGTGYTNGKTDVSEIASQSEITYSLSSGNTSFSTGIAYRIVGKTLYINIGENPFLSGLMMGGMAMGGEEEKTNKYEWLKISLDPALLEELKGDEMTSSDMGKLADQRYWQDLTKSWEQKEFLERPKYVGKDTIRGVPTLRYRTNIKKDQVKQAAQELIDKLLESQTAETKNDTKTFVNGLVDKLEIQDMEIWLGQRDGKVHKVAVHSNAPSVASFAKAMEEESRLEMEAYQKACSDYSKPCDLPASPSTQERLQKLLGALKFDAQFNLAFEFFGHGKQQTVVVPENAYDIRTSLEDARKASRDAKRLADIRQMASALELYFYDNGENAYPATLAELSPQYLGMLPTAPEPHDGKCTAAQNIYTYTRAAGQRDYALTFCVGADVGGYSAGVHTLSASGIN